MRARDADLLLDLLLQHRDRLRHLQPDNEETRRVQNLVEERRKLVDEKMAQINRLIGYLTIYFPQMLQWFDRLDRKLVCDFLERRPSLEELKKVRPAELRKFFGQRQARILFRCWKDRVAYCVAYDENKYLAALARRGSPLNSVSSQLPQQRCEIVVDSMQLSTP